MMKGNNECTVTGTAIRLYIRNGGGTSSCSLRLRHTSYRRSLQLISRFFIFHHPLRPLAAAPPVVSVTYC